MATEDVGVRLSIKDRAKASRELQGFKGDVEGVGAAAERAGQSAERGGRLIRAGLLVAAAGAAALGAIAVKSALDFESQLNEVFTLLPGISGEAMGEIGQQVKDFSVQFGTSTEEVIPALYQAISAGVPQGNVFDFLETANKAAIGGVTDLETAVDGISSVVNAYGSDVISAGEASDAMFTAVRLGKTTFEELSASLFQVNPIAAGLGVDFAEVTSALAAMTAQGVPTSVATTQLRQLLSGLSEEGGATATVFQGLAGQSFTDFVASGGDVQGALQLLERHAADTGVGIQDLFGSVEAGGAALALTGSGTERFTSALEEMGASAGATDAAFDTIDQGTQRAIDRLVAFKDVALISLGQALLPRLANFADFLLDRVVPALEDMADFLGRNRAVIAPLAAAIAGAAVTFGVIIGVTRAWAAAQAILNFALAANPVGIIIVGIGALVGVLIYAWNNSETFRNVVLGVLAAIREGWNILWESVLRPFFGWLSDRWDEQVLAFKVVQLAFAIGWEAVTAAFGSARDFIAGVWASIRSGAESAAAFVIRQINFLIEAFNAAIRLANRIPGVDIGEIAAVPEVGGQRSSGGAARAPSRERGGPVSAGRLFQVNEAGVEFFVPNMSGTVLPVPLAVDGGTRPATVNTFNFNIVSNDPEEVGRTVVRYMRRQEARA